MLKGINNYSYLLCYGDSFILLIFSEFFACYFFISED